jgi:hypothetical protein
LSPSAGVPETANVDTLASLIGDELIGRLGQQQ